MKESNYSYFKLNFIIFFSLYNRHIYLGYGSQLLAEAASLHGEGFTSNRENGSKNYIAEFMLN